MRVKYTDIVTFSAIDTKKKKKKNKNKKNAREKRLNIIQTVYIIHSRGIILVYIIVYTRVLL